MVVIVPNSSAPNAERGIPWLRSSLEIKSVREEGQSHANKLMIIVCRPNNTASSRFAVIASRSVGGAVQRNRCKRVLRACIQNNLAEIKPGFDLLYIARKSLLDAEHAQVLSAFSQANEAAGVAANG